MNENSHVRTLLKHRRLGRAASGQMLGNNHARAEPRVLRRLSENSVSPRFHADDSFK